MKKTGFFRRTTAFAFLVLVLTSVVGTQVAFAQQEAPEAVRVAAASNPWHYLGASLGLGMIVIGAGLGIGRFAAAAAEGISRQPAAATQISGAVLLPLVLLEGVAVLAEVFVLLIVLK